MIVNNIPHSTVVQMAAFQFGDRPVWVGSRWSKNGQFATVVSLFSLLESCCSVDL